MAILKTQWELLDIIPSHIDLAGAEVELVDEVGRENRLKEALEDITGGYDFILLRVIQTISSQFSQTLLCKAYIRVHGQCNLVK